MGQFEQDCQRQIIGRTHSFTLTFCYTAENVTCPFTLKIGVFWGITEVLKMNGIHKDA